MGKAKVPVAAAQSLQAIPVESVRPNPKQPRKHFDAARLRELKDSIDRDGLLQPIVVRRVEDGFELIAGERRWRACKELGLVRIPAMIRNAREDEQLVLALIENLQRADLDPIEEALGYQQLLDEFGQTHDEVAKKVGKDRSTVTNTIRLLDLPEDARLAVSQGLIRAGHARALLPLVGHASFSDTFEAVIRDGMSVRGTEALVRQTLHPEVVNEVEPVEEAISFAEGDFDSDDDDSEEAGSEVEEPPRSLRTPAIVDLEDRLRGVLGVPVRVQVGRRGGSVTFRCARRDELDDLIDRLLRSGRASGDENIPFHV